MTWAHAVAVLAAGMAAGTVNTVVGLNESVQRVNAAKNVLALLVNAVAALLFVLVAHIE